MFFTRSLSFLRLLVLASAVFAAGLAPARAEPLISEFMAANTATLADEDGAFSDWVEIHNPDTTPATLTGWYLTDTASNKTKWQFPELTIPAGGYVVVFASNKNRRTPGATLHTNFALSAGGEYLGLIKADGTTVAHDYAPTFPAQADDVSYGIGAGSDGSLRAGVLSRPTPGAANAAAGAVALQETVTFGRTAGPFRQSFALELSGAGAGQQIRYVIAAGNAGAGAPEPTAASPVYTAALPIDATVVVRAAVFSADGRGRGPVATAHYAKIGAGLAGFSSQLPVVVIDSLGSGELVKDGIDHPSWLYLYEGRGNGTPSFNSAPQTVSPLTSTVRGSSSADFPKRGYNLKFTDDKGGKRAQALLDLPAYEKWALVAPWMYDQSYISNAFTYALSNNIGRWAPRTRLVEVFFNADGGEVGPEDYAGIYVLTDRIEVGKGRVDIASLDANDTAGNALTGGYILKIDIADPDEIGWRTGLDLPDDIYSSVVLVAPKADDIKPAQLDYIRDYVNRMEAALNADHDAGFARRTYLDYIDRASWVDHHLLNALTKNPDALVRSAYFTKPRNGRLMAGPVWDFDRALGSIADGRSALPEGWSDPEGTDFWASAWWTFLVKDPEFMQDWVDRWQSLRTAELSDTALTALVDSLAGTVGTAAADRDAQKWTDNQSIFGSYGAQIEHLRGWLTTRAKWIDAQFVAPPTVAQSGNSLTFTPPAGAQLAYTLDGSDPRSLGGAVAPGTLVVSGPLTVPATANVHVRSYRADLAYALPGSPWSSAVGGDASTPLAPQSRLVNISSRAIVGAGDKLLIAGVVVADTAGKRYLSRAVGPGLGAFGAAGFVPDPQLGIFAANGVELFRNNGWETGPDATRIPGFAKVVGAFPLAAGSLDSALASEVPAGAYTVQITTPTQTSGIALAELYELDSNGRTVNLSTRAFVRTGDGVLIGGFVVAGAAHKRMLIRAVGPTLAAFGVTNALRDAELTVYSGSTPVAVNDRWHANENLAALEAASRNAGAFALNANSEDAALLVTLPPGAYTVEVKGKDGGEGVALLEIYEVP